MCEGRTEFGGKRAKKVKKIGKNKQIFLAILCSFFYLQHISSQFLATRRDRRWPVSFLVLIREWGLPPFYFAAAAVVAAVDFLPLLWLFQLGF